MLSDKVELALQHVGRNNEQKASGGKRGNQHESNNH
jgi:hypothetical protein